jgi:amidase
MMDIDDAFRIGRLDAHDQAALVRQREISALELIEAAIARVQALNPRVNAVVQTLFESARARAEMPGGDGILDRVPILLKESLDYPGSSTRCGSRSRANVKPAVRSYPYTDRLDAHGLIPIGKTNVPEFGLLPTTESLLFGPALNPWAPDLSCGGSSGGSAVAVASGMVPLAHAADGGGSIRIPAACCGVFGLKPSRGANVRPRGQHLIDDLLASDALLSRSVRDACVAFAVTHPTASSPIQKMNPRRLRIALVMTDLNGQPPDAEVAQVLERSAALCAQLGHRVEHASLPVGAGEVPDTFMTVWAYLARELVEHCRADGLQDEVEPWTLGLARWSEQLQTTQLESFYERVVTIPRRLSEFFQSHDVILSPVLPRPSAAVGELAPTRAFDELFRVFVDYVSYTPLHNIAGLPSMSVPLFTTSAGVPMGSMFSAARGADETLLELALELEAAAPWAGRWPP